jgi:16S rRNA (cytosine967-C5)-methyltransferase
MPVEELSRGELPRVVAAEVVCEVLERGAFVAAALDRALLVQPDLDPRDVRLATELSYGVVRSVVTLREHVLAHASKGVSDPRVLAHLLVATYQLLLLDRVPAFAAVDVAVRQAKRFGGARLGGFANAVLRKIAKEPKLDRSAALRHNVPEWLRAELVDAVGDQQADALLGVSAESAEPTTAARFRGRGPLPEWAELGGPGRFVERVRVFRRAGDIRRHPEWARGDFVVQEEGAALCALLLGARTGESVFDACAGRGQKASLLADAIGAEGRLWVSDKNKSKLAHLVAEFERLRLPRPELYIVGTDDSAVPRDFDRVLVDAPCTGTGTLRHRPEIALRLTQDDPTRLAATSRSILENAAARLRPLGTLLFVVCSVLRRECEAVSDAVPGLEPAPFDAQELAGLFPPGATRGRLLPGVHGTDGYYVACFRKLG